MAPARVYADEEPARRRCRQFELGNNERTGLATNSHRAAELEQNQRVYFCLPPLQTPKRSRMAYQSAPMAVKGTRKCRPPGKG
jgi:hypothetical protein